MYDSKIVNVRVEKINLDLECFMDLSQGRGIRLASPLAYNKKNEKIEDGLQSEFFGSDFGSEHEFAERYSCKCKKYIGKSYEGIICENCETEVAFNDTDLTKTGWIILDNFSVISPIFCAKLLDALGTYEGNKVLYRILDVKYSDKGADADNKEELKFKELEELKKHPFVHKGMRWLQENIIEVIEYYERKKPGKLKLFNELKNDLSIIFTSCIPVYTALLRTELPGVKGSKLFKMKINTIYQSIIRTSNFINKFSEEDLDDRSLTSIDIQLASMQSDIMDIFNVTYNELTSKKGMIMSKVMG